MSIIEIFNVLICTCTVHAEFPLSPAPPFSFHILTGLEDLQDVSVYLKRLKPYELFRLGRELHLNQDNLQAHLDNHTQRKDMLAAMLKEWLTKEDDYPPTWRVMGEALKDVGLGFITRKIEKDKILV